jgi:anti-sigma-K factor RskA
MSEGDRQMPDREGLAAEYVLGTLSHAERLTAEALLTSDAAFAAEVARWEARLAPLNDEFAPVDPPPALRARIDARLFPKRARRRGLGWPVWGALAAAVAVAIWLVAVPLQREPLIVATLQAENQPLVMLASYDPNRRSLSVEHNAGPTAGSGRDYELWVIHEGEAPVSLGIVREATTVSMDLPPPGTVLAITLEPEGGSPTGQATGPILVTAVLGQG